MATKMTANGVSTTTEIPTTSCSLVSLPHLPSADASVMNG